MKNVMKFLGVEANQESNKPETYKQAQTSLSSAIENYYDLYEIFSDTRWASFFEE
jgi:hypothetical protein